MSNIQEFEDKLIVEGINSQGYGIMPKMIMQDKRLTIESKAIYAYLVSYAGAGSSAFPGLKRILADLCISENRFYRHRKLLIDCGYISVNPIRNEKKVIIKNIYTLHSNPEKIGIDTEKGVSSNLKDRVSHKTEDTGTPQNEGRGTVTPLSKSNSLKSTSSFKKNDDDENLINKQKSEIIDLGQMIESSNDLKELTQLLVESDIDFELTEQIVNHFYQTKEIVDLNIVKQQLNWMIKKNKTDLGISDFRVYFINGYKMKINNANVSVSEYHFTDEDLPPVPMHNWLGEIN